MIHPIFMTTLKRPDLVFQHLANYADLLKCEAADIGKGLLVQAAAGVVAGVALILSLGLTGIAVMLGVLNGRFHWALVAVPAVAWLAAILAGLVAARSRIRDDVREVREEVERDLQILGGTKELNDA